MKFRVGDPVMMVDKYAERMPCVCRNRDAAISSFNGMRGEVKAVEPLMVLFRGDNLPMRFDERDFVLDEPSS